MDDSAYTVGALAKASGLTVRTLHHWDAIGLLSPASRGGNGYRRYGDAEIARLAARRPDRAARPSRAGARRDRRRWRAVR